MKLPIRIFSDLHLGHPACQIDSADHLSPLFEGAGTVIFNGDTIEHRHTKLREAGMRHLDRLRDVLEKAGVESVFIRGNHDPGIFDLEYVELAGGRVLVTHGDGLFPLLSPWSREIWAAEEKIEAVRAGYDADALSHDLDTTLACTQECRFLPEEPEFDLSSSKLRRRLHSLARIVWPPQVPIKILHSWSRIPRQAHGFLERYRPEAKVLLFGHTHLPGIWHRHDRVAINTGGFRSILWARGVELVDGELKVRKIKRSGANYVLGSPILNLSLADGDQ